MTDNNFLPGMGRGSNIGKAISAAKRKEPHQMTPEEFAAAPNAVFHTSHLEPHVVRDESFRATRYRLGKGTSPHIHVGTEQAAIENAGRTTGSGDPARLYVFHYIPKFGDNFRVQGDGEHLVAPQKIRNKVYRYNDSEEEEPDTHDNHTEPVVVYRNEHEDKGAISLSVGDFSRLKSQADYVREAIASGKADEVHPKTMAMYKDGVLDTGGILPKGFAENVKRKGRGLPVGGRTGGGMPAVLEPLDVEPRPHGWGRPADNYGFGEGWRTPASETFEHQKERYSDNGPDLNTLMSFKFIKKHSPE